MKLLFLNFLQKILKLEEPVESSWKILRHLWKSQKSPKKLEDYLKLVISVKKGADLIKILTDMAFLMKTIKYKAIQPLQGMELQRFYNKLFNFFKYF